jgi:hypothetical protein
MTFGEPPAVMAAVMAVAIVIRQRAIALQALAVILITTAGADPIALTARLASPKVQMQEATVFCVLKGSFLIFQKQPAVQIVRQVRSDQVYWSRPKPHLSGVCVGSYQGQTGATACTAARYWLLTSILAVSSYIHAGHLQQGILCLGTRIFRADGMCSWKIRSFNWTNSKLHGRDTSIILHSARFSYRPALYALSSLGPEHISPRKGSPSVK